MSVHFVWKDEPTTMCGLFPLEHLAEQLTITSALVTCPDCRAVMDAVLARALEKMGPIEPISMVPPDMPPYPENALDGIPESGRVKFIREGGARLSQGEP